MPFLERAADDRRGLVCQVLVDDEERGADAVARQHVEQIEASPRGSGPSSNVR